jgi:hypothetical protein
LLVGLSKSTQISRISFTPEHELRRLYLMQHALSALA